MIILFEMVQVGPSHAPFTRSFTEMVGRAFPGETIEIHALQSHLAEAFSTVDPAIASRLVQKPIVVQPRGIRGVLDFVKATLNMPKGQGALVVFLSCNPTVILAAKCLRRMREDFRCHLVLHGDIVTIADRRSRNPYHRINDYTFALGRANHPDIRFVVLEAHIKENVVRVIPTVAPYMDVVLHPCTETPMDETPPPGAPLRVGLLGIAGKSKGLDAFAEVAKRCREAGLPVDFRLVGKLQPGWQKLDLTGIGGPLPFSETWLPKSVFEAEIRGLHYVMLPYDVSYYGYAASGVFLDALRFRRPIIGLNSPVIDMAFEQYGNVGYRCRTVDEMYMTIERLAKRFDALSYGEQRRSLERAYADRLPDAMAPGYAALVARQFHFSVAAKAS